MEFPIIENSVKQSPCGKFCYLLKNGKIGNHWTDFDKHLCAELFIQCGNDPCKISQFLQKPCNAVILL